MCRKIQCPTCNKASWAGCGKHITSALKGVAVVDRCHGWATGTCTSASASTVCTPATTTADCVVDRECALATPAELRAALAAGAPVVDLRPSGSSESVNGVYEVVASATSAVFADGKLPLGRLPTDKDAALILHCRSGRRVKAAATYLVQQGYTNLVNGGGPAGPADLWSQFGSRIVQCPISPTSRILLQLFDGPVSEGGSGSSTLTYILGDPATKEAILIDPVLEQVDRDTRVLEEHGLELVLVLNTHAHADHMTGSGELKRKIPGLRSAISAASGAKADVLLTPGQELKVGAGTLRVLATPGHTAGCVSFYDEQSGAVFTGDALFIAGCGRTDFQGGSSDALYDSVHSQLFSLPGSTLVYPAHDYKGGRVSTIAHERAYNPRLVLDKSAFVAHMANLKLSPPKKLAEFVPANMMCGIQD